MEIKKISTLLIFSLLFISSICFSQAPTSKNKKAIKLYEEAEVFVKQRRFDAAVTALLEAVEKDPKFVEAHLKLGGIYKTLGEKDKSKYHYVKAVELRPKSKSIVGTYYTVGEIYFNDGDYENAKINFDKVVSLKPDKQATLDQALKDLEKCNFAIEAKKNPLKFNPVVMDATINKFYMHGYPVLTADQQYLIYSMREGFKPEDDENIVVSKKVDGKWTTPVSISDKINTQYNEGACSISGDGKTLVFATCNKPDGLGACDIYITYKEGEEWSVPKNLGPKVNTNVWDSEPTISADGKTIYFSSERKGGFGREDIWYTTQDEDGEWTQAKNMGAPINTEGREVAPFIHANNSTFYFSSTSHLGMGGFDIFLSYKKDTVWTAPKNIGYPINTERNDATIFITSDSKKGFYSIYEKKGMEYSKALLYEFDVPSQLQIPPKATYAKGIVYDSETKKKIGAKIELIDLKNQKVIQRVTSDKINGDYLFVLTEGSEFALYVSKEGYMFKSIFFNYKDPNTYNSFDLDIYLDPIKVGAGVVLNNIFFASKSYHLEDKSKTELNKIILFLKANPKVSIELGGHTDIVGSDKDNMVLSEKRAQAVYDYLVKAGVSPSKLKYKGYGETQFIAPNDTEENRLLNRRIEFKIISQ